MDVKIEIARYRGACVDQREAPSDGEISVEVTRKGDEIVVDAVAQADVSDFGIDLVLTLSDWRGGYVLVPGAVYDGNRFRVLDVPYPPMYGEEGDEDAGPLVTDVPRLPAFHLLSGDASFPAMGVWSPSAGRAWVVSFPAATELGYTGLRVEEGADSLSIRIQLPGVREERYTMVDTRSASDDRGASVRAGWTMNARVAVVEAESRDVDGLFALMDANRNQCVVPGAREKLRPLSSAADLVRGVTMSSRWFENPGYFETADSDHGIPFQVGWVGGGITSFPLLESDDPAARRRSRKNVDFICERLQGPSGFFFGGYRDDGPYNDGFDHPHAEHWVMVRKNGDMLLFLLRHILSLQASGQPIPETWKRTAKACAEAFVRTWAMEEHWGQFVDVRNGRVVVKGSACGGTALAGLALAAKFFDEPRFLETAEAAGARYGVDCVAPGLLTGGPGEILKAPDSESAFGLLEGYVALWEATTDPRWLDLAAQTARQAASWVVSYDFPFPPDSTFGRMGMLTSGTVIANVQNKHSAPGICTGSALPLLKLFRATGERRWLDLAVEISHALPQYVSSAERPIVAHDGRSLPPGWVNERVNMADWEAPERGVGEVYCGPCWSMATVLLTALEMPGVYVDPTRGVVACADHVEARIEGEALVIVNPTAFDARVRVMVDHDPSRPLGELWWRGDGWVDVPAGGSVERPLG